MSSHIFRQYDIRGKAATDLTDAVVESIGRAFGTYALGRGYHKVFVGRDNRLSSDRIRDALVKGITGTGCDVTDIGRVVTPILYYACAAAGGGAGVMITGSHNPPDENGFKMVCGTGTIYGAEIQALREMIQQGVFAEGQGAVATMDVVDEYLCMLQERIKLGPRGLKVAVDCGNGTGALFAERVLQGWGCWVVPLHCVSDGRFPNHEPDPVKSANLQDLRRAVMEQGCDMGVAYDGDADRIGVVDDRGGIVWGDRLMALFWREILPKYPDRPCIVEVKCSQTLVDEIERLGGRACFYKTGHSLIKAKMKEVGAVFTGEMSGHMFFADEYYGFDDAFYATGRLLRLLSQSDRPLSVLLADLPGYCSTAETRVPCTDAGKFAVVDALTEHFRRRYDVIDVDGVRVLFEDGWGLVRCSNTQPVLVARCEARTPEGLERICRVMQDALRRYPEVADFEWAY